MELLDLDPADAAGRERCAELLVDVFRDLAPDAWPNLPQARETVDECLNLGPVRVARIDGVIVGWIGARHSYSRVWELHPLAVQPSLQGQGIGRALVKDLEEQVRLRGGLTITLGSDDEDNMTSLSNVDLYENLWEKIRDIRNIKNHPYGFYQKMGYVITGVVPDANGRGKPDILMAKRIR